MILVCNQARHFPFYDDLPQEFLSILIFFQLWFKTGNCVQFSSTHLCSCWCSSGLCLSHSHHLWSSYRIWQKSRHFWNQVGLPNQSVLRGCRKGHSHSLSGQTRVEVFDKKENYILCIYRPEIWINKKRYIYHAFLKPASINDDNRYETYFYHFCFNYSRVLVFLVLYLFLFLFQCWSLTHLWKAPLRVSCQVSLC